jgi:hypothetical protein
MPCIWALFLLFLLFLTRVLFIVDSFMPFMLFLSLTITQSESNTAMSTLTRSKLITRHTRRLQTPPAPNLT